MDRGPVNPGSDRTAPPKAPGSIRHSEAFVWDELHGMRNVRSVLVDELGLDLTGWTLEHADAISADGTTIVGYGTNPSGLREVWVAVIPEPGTAALVTLGLLGLAARCFHGRRWRPRADSNSRHAVSERSNHLS